MGGSGAGKTTLARIVAKGLEKANRNGEFPNSFIYIDVKGDDAWKFLAAADVLDPAKITFLDPSETGFSLNPFELPPYEEKDVERVRSIYTGFVMKVIEEWYGADPARAPRMLRIFRSLISFLYTITDAPTFVDLHHLVVGIQSGDENVLREIEEALDGADFESLRRELDAIADMRSEAFDPVLTRLSEFAVDPHLRRLFGGVRHSSVNFEELLKPGKQVIIRAPSQDIGLHIGPLIQSVILLKLWFAVLWRTTRTQEEERTPVVIWLDEFSDFQRLQAIQTILSQARSQGLCLMLSHQTTAQLDDTLLEIVMGNCVPGNYLISGAYIPISKMRVGDVCVGGGGLQKTTAVFRRRYDGEMVVLRALGILPLTLTPEHPLLVVPKLGPKYKGRHEVIGTRWGTATWKLAKDIIPLGRSRKRGDYLVIPRLKGTMRTRRLSLRPFATDARTFAISKGWGKSVTFPLDEDTAWLLGIYVAEGCGKDRAIFCFNRNETELQGRVLELGRRFGYSPYLTFCPSETLVKVPSRLLARAFQKWCGHGATNKRIPEFILFHEDLRLLKAFLDGYLAGDGSTRGKKAMATTTSRILAYQLQLGFARLGRFFGINAGRREGKGEIQGRVVRIHDSFNIVNTESWVHIFPDKILVPVHGKGVMKYHGMVYNLGTEDNTFLINNVVGHNCSSQGAGKVSGVDAPRLARAWDLQFKKGIEQALITQPDFTWTFRLRAGPGEEQDPPIQGRLLMPPEQKHDKSEIQAFCAKMRELYGADRTEGSVFEKEKEEKPEWTKFLLPGQPVPTKKVWRLLIAEEAPPRLQLPSR